MPTLAELLQVKSKDQVLQVLLTTLADKDLPVDDWNVGGVERTQLEIEASVMEDLYRMVPQIAGAGLLYSEWCVDDWVDLIGESFYKEFRNPSAVAIDTLRLMCAADQGPYTIGPGDLWAATSNGLLYSNLAGGTLAAGGTLDLTFQAESPGSVYNVARNTITVLKTPLPGVTCTNIMGGLVQSGRDREEDATYKERCTLKWASIALGAPDAFYEYWARKADPTITKVKVVTQPRGQGTVDVVIWGEGGLGVGVPAAAQAFVRTKAPLTDDAGVEVYSATEHVVTLTGTATVRAGYLAKAQATAAANLTQLQKDTKIGGQLIHAAVVDAVMGERTTTGMINAVFTTEGFAPDSPITLDDLEALTIVNDLDWVEE